MGGCASSLEDKQPNDKTVRDKLMRAAQTGDVSTMELCLDKVRSKSTTLHPFKPEFSIVIFIHYKPRIAAAILDLQWMKMI